MALARLIFAKPAKANQASSAPSYKAIDEYVSAQMKRLHILRRWLSEVTGCALPWFWKGAAGRRNSTPQTPFFIGSITSHSPPWR
jgi:hypothetical protein